jgi:hypothetical protein
MLRLISWRLGSPLVVAVALGCSHSGQFTWSPSFGTPDLTTIDRAKWDEYVGRIVQVRGSVEQYKRGPMVGGTYIDGVRDWPEGNGRVVVTGNLVRHDDRVFAENGAQAIGGVYYSLSSAKWSLDN